jgi:integrase
MGATRAKAADARPRDIRDVALLLVGRDLLARASELVGIDREAVTFNEGKGTALVRLRRRKTDTESKPCYVGSEATSALKRWLAVSGIESGPLFVSVNKGGKVKAGARLNVCEVGRVLKALAKRAGLESADVSGHSLRVGMAQDMTGANISGSLIQQAAGWSTPRMLARYTANLEAEEGGVAQYHQGRKFR